MTFPAGMLREATGIGLDETITLAFAYWGYLQGRGPGDPIRVKGMAAPAMTIPRADVETFLGLFSSALDAGTALRDVQDYAGHKDPRTTRRYDHARDSLDRNAAYAVAAYLA